MRKPKGRTLGAKPEKTFVFSFQEGLIDSWCKRMPGAALPPMMRLPAGALRGYAAARGDENVDYMVARGRLERRER
jgi:hypothetical protein